ncbi:MAG: NADH-quinone oxidoreductase subunit NuoE [Ktedonobacterales bacterium]
MISDDVKAQLREIVSRYPVARSGMLPCLHLVQDVEGYVTPEGIAAVAEAVGAKVDEVESVVTFYSMYHQKPIGKHVIKVCTSVSCYLMGCDDVLAHLEKRLGISRGQTTPDGRYTLQAVECLAACGLAPALQVNNEFVENVTPQVADALLERLEHGKGIEDMGGKWEFAGKAAGTSEDAANAGAQRKRA